MNEFFGIDMTYIMIALLAVLFIAISTIIYVALRNRVMFQIGVRNIPRRRAQTILIIIGLMLSTLIISTALSIGDNADYSITSQTYTSLQSIDEIVAARTDDGETAGTGDDEETDEDPSIGLGGLVSAVPIPMDEADGFVADFKALDGVDGAIPIVRAPAPALHEASGQAEPLTLLMGVPDDMTGFEDDLRNVDGGTVAVADLSENELYASDSASDELDLEPGDTVTFTLGEEQADGTVQTVVHQFSVRAVVENSVLTGSLLDQAFGFTLRMEELQDIVNRTREVDMIAVSNDGGVRDGVEGTDAVTDELNAVLEGTPWAAEGVKAELVETAAEVASIFTTIFVVLGLFSIAAGMLLIFLIFVMLAAERKVEMGMIRAVGTKRSHLVQIFMSEGMIYNMVAAAIGCALGVLVSIVLVGVMARLFSEFGLQITFHVTPRSLIVAYSIGVVLTFLTVTFSSWRIGNLNIVSAIRDTADPVTTKERPRISGLLGLVRYVAWILFKPATWRQFFVALGITVLGVIIAAIGFGMFLGAIALYDTSGVASVLAVLLAILGGLVIVVGAVALLAGLSGIFQWGPLMLMAGPLLMIQGLSANQAFSFGAGFSLAIIGAALVIRFIGAPARPVFTTMGLLILFFWLLFAGGNSPFERINNLDGDIEMFFLSGVTMVIAGTFVLVYNADLLLGLLTLTGGLFSSLVPSIKTAVAYPLANKFRTGMTIAMISLVMFSLVMFSTMNENFDRIFLSDDALAGYEVQVTENPGNPIDDLESALRNAPPPPAPTNGDEAGPSGDEIADQIVNDDPLLVANQQVADVVQLNVEEPEASGYPIFGMSPEFVENNELTFSARANGFATDEDILRALAENPDYAIIDNFAIGGGFDGAVIEGVEPTDKTFEPIPMEIVDSATGASRRVELIGIMTTTASGIYFGMYVSEEAFADVYETPETRMHYLSLVEGADAREVAQGIERTLLSQGVQADSLRKIVDDYQAQSRGFTYLLQGFMGIGLFVGIAAVGVIAFRTVVERRQQIGMLRAIGYTRRAIALSFLMESSFTALLGIFSGIALGLLLAQQLVMTDEFVAGGVPSFYIPWVQILAIAAFAFIASLVMTIIPSRQAASIPIAEALRYE